MITATGVDVRLAQAHILADVDFSTLTGSMVGLIGPNGSGKSTLLRCLHGTLRPQGGAVLIDGRAVESLSRRTIARSVAVAAQDGARDNVGMSVGEYVLLGRHPHRGDHQGFGPEDEAIALDALTRVEMAEVATRSLHDLSGGERQRVLIARCIAQRTPLLLLDEPTNHLDIRFQHEVLALVRRLELTTVVVLHDLNLASRYCDHLVLLDGGRVVATGRADQVLQPDVLQAVYGVDVRRLIDGEVVHLAFGPLPAGRSPL